MKPTIEEPKVFISYAWGTEEYQQKVIAFATDLMNDGIDVVIDRWSLKEGNDTYAFMEQSVTDDTITNVLILLDPQYEKKANERVGGVGTETQIISAEVYNKVKQDKFLPVIFERYQNDDVPKPAYLKGRLHFDLTVPERYDSEYKRLVKRLYGIEIIPKPEKGKSPAWLEEPSTVSMKIRNEYSILKNNMTGQIRTEKFEAFLEEIKRDILQFKKDKITEPIKEEDYIEVYKEAQNIRNQFIQLMQYISYISDGEKILAAKLEEIISELKNMQESSVRKILETLLHEIFIYIVAILYKKHLYDEINYLLGRPYFVADYYRSVYTFNVFYENNNELDKAVCKRDNKNYHSGVANLWLDTINVDVCSKSEFVFADLLCFNASVFMTDYKDDWYWFPICYVYAAREGGLMKTFAIKLRSKEHAENVAKLFGLSDIDSLKERFDEVKEMSKTENLKGYRYSGAFVSAPLITDYLVSADIGMYR